MVTWETEKESWLLSEVLLNSTGQKSMVLRCQKQVDVLNQDAEYELESRQVIASGT